MRIKDAYINGFSGNGVFSDLQLFDVPWKNDNIASSLDTIYYNRSDDKIASKFITRRMEDDELLPSARSIIAASLFTMFGTTWGKLYDTLSMEYNPIENYRMTETETTNHTIENESTNTGTDTNTDSGNVTITNTGTNTTNDTGTLSTSDTGTATTTDTGTDNTTNTGTVSNSGSNSATNSVYGFNSSNAVDSDEVNGTNSDTETRNLTQLETRNLTQQETRNLSQQETRNLTQQETRNLSQQETRNLTQQETRNLQSTNSETGENERELLRSGNIGVTTSQQLLQSEIELWKWQFYIQVFNDIDSVLTLPIY